MFVSSAGSHQQHFLPDLTDSSESSSKKKFTSTASNQCAGSNNKSKSQEAARSSGKPKFNHLDLLPRLQTISNSAIVHQRLSTSSSGSSVGDHLAVASVQTGASVPLMIGNRPKCVVNLVDQPQTQTNLQTSSSNGPAAAPLGPQNTAIRAEQRRQNMSVSVVRPVVVVSGHASSAQSDSSASSKSSVHSLLEDWMALDGAVNSSFKGAATIDDLLYSIKTADQMPNFDGPPLARHQIKNTEQERQHVIAFARREQHELNRNVRRQHQFMLDKLNERKRHLSIVQSVWVQRDFKHAIEKLVDIYHQGLIFTSDSGPNSQRASKLKSLNTSLVVDVISIIILRPKLWTLEICQLLLPIINQDLLMQSQYEYYTEVGLKALKLILAHFSSIITGTLESLKDSGKLVGVDLSREDRINKCLACYKLLLESHSVMSQKQAAQHKNGAGQQCKLAAFQRELQAMFGTLFSSIQLDSSVLAKRFC